MMRLFCTVINIIIIWVISLGFAQGQANDSIEIRTIGIPPYGIQEKNKPSGFYFEVSNLVAKEAGYTANNYVYPYIRIINELKTGQTDMSILFKYEELEEYVVYVAPLATLKTVVIGLNGTEFKTISSLKGKTIAYLRGAKFSDDIDNDPEIIKEITTDFLQGVKMLKFGRVDAIIGPLDPILSAANKITDGEYIFGKPLVVAERTPWIQISNKSASELSVRKLRTIILKLKERGVIKEIRQKYIGSEKSK